MVRGRSRVLAPGFRRYPWRDSAGRSAPRSFLAAMLPALSSRVGALAVVGLVPLAGATLASALGHRCPPLVQWRDSLVHGPVPRAGGAQGDRNRQADPA